jgi:hypothetical protein
MFRRRSVGKQSSQDRVVEDTSVFGDHVNGKGMVERRGDENTS